MEFAGKMYLVCLGLAVLIFAIFPAQDTYYVSPVEIIERPIEVREIQSVETQVVVDVDIRQQTLANTALIAAMQATVNKLSVKTTAIDVQIDAARTGMVSWHELLVAGYVVLGLLAMLLIYKIAKWRRNALSRH